MYSHASLLLNYWTTGSKTINHNFMLFCLDLKQLLPTKNTLEATLIQHAVNDDLSGATGQMRLSDADFSPFKSQLRDSYL